VGNVALFCFLLAISASPFKSKRRREADNAALRHQLMVLRRKVRSRVRLTNNDRLWPSLLGAAQVVQPETILRWHRAGFKAFWRWKSRKRVGRKELGVSWQRLLRSRAGLH
jgi:hypothetical protein